MREISLDDLERELDEMDKEPLQYPYQEMEGLYIDWNVIDFKDVKEKEEKERGDDLKNAST